MEPDQYVQYEDGTVEVENGVTLDDLSAVVNSVNTLFERLEEHRRRIEQISEVQTTLAEDLALARKRQKPDIGERQEHVWFVTVLCISVVLVIGMISGYAAYSDSQPQSHVKTQTFETR